MSDERARIVALDKRRVWHPYTPMDDYRARVDPLVVARAEGSWLVDVDGRRYLDGNASWWVCALGHNHPRLVAALKRQADLLCHSSLAGATHEGAAELAESLCQAAPRGLEHVFFSDDGSTAVEVAMKLALQYWAQNGRPSRRRFLALEGAFHGETLGATALGGVEVFRRPFAGSLLDCIHVPSPAEENDYARAFEALERIVRKDSQEIAAVVIEPLVQGASGMRIYASAYLRALRDLCDASDVFLVADEVFTGYGRTGAMWACDHAGVSPDLLCVAKGFSGGMLPMAATLTTSRIFEGFLGASERAFYYGHSFCGNPLGAAVAREVLRIYEEERVVEGVRARAARVAKAFTEMANLPGVVRTRALGMVGALDLSGTTGYLGDAGWRVYEEARRRGAYLRPLGNVVYVAPSLVISDQDLAQLLSIVRESVAAVAKR
jgi:adenosylmethionine-8-amino-7-oxononanoate aminotransferase